MGLRRSLGVFIFILVFRQEGGTGVTLPTFFTISLTFNCSFTVGTQGWTDRRMRSKFLAATHGPAVILGYLRYRAMSLALSLNSFGLCLLVGRAISTPKTKNWERSFHYSRTGIDG